MVIFLATSAEIQVPHPDDLLLIQALAHRGHEAKLLTWGTCVKDAQIVIRTTWDYYRRLTDFLLWTAEVEDAGSKLINPSATVRWNSNKLYLLDLQELGVPMLETHLVDSSSPLPDSHFVLKPTISAGAFLTKHFVSHELARKHIDQIAQVGAQTLLQPYAEEIHQGELSLIFFAIPQPVFSHAVLKKPKGNDFRVQSEFGGQNTRVDVSHNIISQALEALSHVPESFVYARVDGIVRGATLMLMEIELIEPELFTQYAPETSHRFADAIVYALNP